MATSPISCRMACSTPDPSGERFGKGGVESVGFGFVMTVWIVGLLKCAEPRMLAVGARRVVHMLQFNGKQEEAKVKL